MKTNKKTLLTLTCSLLIVPIWLLLFKNGISLRKMSDTYFMLSLAFLIVGVFNLVLSSGFFDLFQKNMKQLIHLRRNNEPKEFVPFSNIFSHKPVLSLTVGISLLLLSLLLSFMV